MWMRKAWLGDMISPSALPRTVAEGTLRSGDIALVVMEQSQSPLPKHILIFHNRADFDGGVIDHIIDCMLFID